MSTGPAGGGYHTSEDEQILHRMGYAQELFRAMGGFQNFAISFTIISILAGCLTSYYIAFNNGGPIAISWGWLWVGLMSTLISLAMAEIASAFPTAGGLYYWSSKLGSPAWGWFTGWFNLVGQIAVTAAIGYGLAIFATSLINLWFDYPNTKEWTLLTYSVVMLIAVLLNMMKVSLTAMLNTISAYWHMAGVAFIVLVLIIVPDNHQSVSYVFTETINNSGFSGTNFGSIVFWYVFGLGLLMSQYTITGFDASAHMAEETHQASRMAAVGMYMSVVASVVFGWILLLAVTFAVPDTQGVARRGRRRRDLHLDDVDERDLGGDPALHLLRRADVLPHGVGHVCVADDVRVLARPCRPRPSALAEGRRQQGAGRGRVGDRLPRLGADDPDVLELRPPDISSEPRSR